MKKVFEKAWPWIVWALRVAVWALRRAARWTWCNVIRLLLFDVPIAFARLLWYSISESIYNIRHGNGDAWPEEEDNDDTGADLFDDYDNDDAGQIAAVKAEIDYYGEKLDGAFYRMSTATTSAEREKAADAVNRYRQRIATAERKIDKLLAQEE